MGMRLHENAHDEPVRIQLVGILENPDKEGLIASVKDPDGNGVDLFAPLAVT